MGIALSNDHRMLATTVADFLDAHNARRAHRQLLESETERLPDFWEEMAALGWLAVHLPEDVGGSSFGMPELVVIVEELGRAVAPGPFVPTVIASAVIAAVGTDDLKQRYLPGLARGDLVAGVCLSGDLSVDRGTISGTAEAVLGGGLADVMLVACGDDVVVLETASPEVSISVPANVDPARRCGRVSASGVEAVIVPGARGMLVDMARLVLAAEATGVAAACTRAAADYANVRVQFGRPIGTFQAVKHHCANMSVATELATAAAWDAARSIDADAEQRHLATAVAAALAIPAAVHNAELNIQVHGGIGFTWEHDAHLYFRRALAIRAFVDDGVAAEDVTAMTRRSVTRTRVLELPPEAEAVRQDVRRFAQRIAGLDADAQRAAMLDEGYAMPHWPTPWGRDAEAAEQLVIEEEFAAVGILKPRYIITGHILTTLISHADDAQIARWVGPALRGEVIWCQLFSEPDAGSDAASITTKATRVDGGWLVSGQKVWTTQAREATFGLATVRTNLRVPKHKGISMMVVDMQSDGITVRPLRTLMGGSEFNEVFLDDVFVPDNNVVGPVDSGWTVARATLGNESVTVGRGTASTALSTPELIAAVDTHPSRLPGGEARLGRYIARCEANEVMSMRAAQRAVAGGEPGPEAAITKLVFSEAQQEAAEIAAALAGPSLAYLEGVSGAATASILSSRVWSIGGGTSEIKRNQIGERVLGLPRDPLLA